jgi:hypothetical protein
LKSGDLPCRFTLRTLLLIVLAGALVGGFAAQQRRITRLHAQLASPASDEPVLLFLMPADGSSSKLAGYLGGQFVELGDSLALKSRRHTLDVRIDGAALVVETAGKVVRCQTLHYDPASGELKTDDPQFFERLGFDFDLIAGK